MTVKIDKKIPVPLERSKGGAIRQFPWLEMKPGDSFFVSGYQTAGSKPRGGSKWMSLHYAKVLVPGSRWTMRTVTEGGVVGVRVWRVK